MSVVLASIFRNAYHYLDRFVDQVSDLREMLGSEFSLVLGEGDSSDGTEKFLPYKLEKAGLEFEIVTVNHGGPTFGSVDDAQRWRQISQVCNAVLDRIPFEADRVVYVESDLIWKPETLIKLLDHTVNYPAIAAMNFDANDGHFYDSWGHRSGGTPFSNNPPYHKFLTEKPGSIITMDSAGSVIAMRGEVARNCRYDPPEMGMVGFGLDIWRKGYSLHLDPTLSVFHP
jgi:hypothetical protein